MFGLIKMLWKFAWLAVFILGVRRAMEIVHDKLNEVVDNVEEGETGGLERTLSRLHDALHRRQVRHVPSSAASAVPDAEAVLAS